MCEVELAPVHPGQGPMKLSVVPAGRECVMRLRFPPRRARFDRTIRTIVVLLLLAAPAAVSQTPAAPLDSARPTSDTARRVRRIPLTPELERSAFRDARARTLLTRAREARMAQDSALRSYDAKSYMRVSVGLGVRRLGPERLLFRAEQAARVRWARESGVWVEPTGRRAVVPMGGADIDMSPATPIPYFPGREALWFPSEELRKVREEVNEADLIHPLAKGAEAYYRYATGDSVRFRLPDGRSVNLRELRITARRPEWRAFVGSFWFDTDQGNLVRAAYRMAAEVDVWREVNEETRREIEELERKAATDTGKAARAAREHAERHRDDIGVKAKIMQGMFSPMRARISAITVEYGLYEGRFWLPKQNVLEGDMLATFLRVPVRYEESYQYNSVNGTEPVPRVPVAGEAGLTADDTVFYAQGNINIGDQKRPTQDTSAAAVRLREDSIVAYRYKRADSLTVLADSLQRSGGDTSRITELRMRATNSRGIARTIVRRREQCATDSTYFAGIRSVYGVARMAIRLPCDTARLSRSPDLPASIYEKGEEMFSTSDRDELLEGLDFSLQPGWGPQRPAFHTGLDLMRYNRIEGLSVGASLTSASCRCRAAMDAPTCGSPRSTDWASPTTTGAIRSRSARRWRTFSTRATKGSTTARGERNWEAIATRPVHWVARECGGGSLASGSTAPASSPICSSPSASTSATPRSLTTFPRSSSWRPARASSWRARSASILAASGSTDVRASKARRRTGRTRWAPPDTDVWCWMER
jgi:hypothetical protein